MASAAAAAVIAVPTASDVFEIGVGKLSVTGAEPCGFLEGELVTPSAGQLDPCLGVVAQAGEFFGQLGLILEVFDEPFCLESAHDQHSLIWTILLEQSAGSQLD